MDLWGWETRWMHQDPPFSSILLGDGCVRHFAPSDVVAFAKANGWGDARIEFYVRLRDGVEVRIIANRLDKEAERWIRRIAKPFKAPIPGRNQWLIVWNDLVANKGE